MNFLYSGSDMWFQNSVHVKAPVYVTRDLHLESTAKIDGEAEKAAIGRDLYLKNLAEPDRPDGRQRPEDRRDSRGALGSSKATPALHSADHPTPMGQRR